MRALFLTLVAIFNICSLHAQVNLVKNPSLEDHWRTPVTLDDIAFANYWSCIDTLHTYPAQYDTFGNPNCTPEYLNVDATSSCCTVPLSPGSHQYCRTGSGMAKMAMFWNNHDSSALATFQRDYLQGRLYSQLLAGQSYCVTFYVAMVSGSSYAINSIGAYLDDGSMDTNSNCGFPHPEYVQQVMDTFIISDSLNWTKVQGSFIANGTEKYITIGNFHDTAHTSKIRLNGGNWGYYFVDDISVINSSVVATAGSDVSIAAGDTAWVGVDSNGDGMPCYWYMLGGTSPIDSGGRIGVHPIATTTYVVSMDLCGTVTYDTVTVTVSPLGIGNAHISRFANVRIYPNPTMGNCTIQHAQGAQLIVYDLLGHVIEVGKESVLTIISDSEDVHLGALATGVYFAEFTDPVTGYKITRKIVKE